MQDSRTILYDSGRFPLWFRIPALLFGLFVLWLGISVAAYGLFGVSLGPGVPARNSLGTALLGSLVCFLIAAAWIFIWFAQLRILFDAERRELIVWTRGYTRPHEQRIPLAACRQFRVYYAGAGITGHGWQVTAEFEGGRVEQVTKIPSGIEALADSLEAATKLPVIKHEREV